MTSRAAFRRASADVCSAGIVADGWNLNSGCLVMYVYLLTTLSSPRVWDVATQTPHAACFPHVSSLAAAPLNRKSEIGNRKVGS
jgi:hypothetical protein